jgi:hypothetical protein
MNSSAHRFLRSSEPLYAWRCQTVDHRCKGVNCSTMKPLLKLKHWQLFLLTWGIPIAMNIYSFIDPTIRFHLIPVMMMIFGLTVFGWIWAIATVLHKKLPATVHLNINVFRTMFSIPVIYILLIVFWINYASLSGPGPDQGNGFGLEVLPLVIGIHLLSIVCILLGLRFAAKTLKSVELGRLAKFSDYAGEFLLIWFSPIGIWILQPRLNKLIHEESSV